MHIVHHIVLWPADPSVATAAGVVGSLDATLGGLQGKTILVHGVGKVGEATALMLRDGGARVLATDIIPGLNRCLPPKRNRNEHLG